METRNRQKNRLITHATSDLGICLDGKMVLYLEDLANPKNNPTLPHESFRVAREIEKTNRKIAKQ